MMSDAKDQAAALLEDIAQKRPDLLGPAKTILEMLLEPHVQVNVQEGARRSPVSEAHDDGFVRHELDGSKTVTVSLQPNVRSGR